MTVVFENRDCDNDVFLEIEKILTGLPYKLPRVPHAWKFMLNRDNNNIKYAKSRRNKELNVTEFIFTDKSKFSLKEVSDFEVSRISEIIYPGYNLRLKTRILDVGDTKVSLYTF